MEQKVDAIHPRRVCSRIVRLLNNMNTPWVANRRAKHLGKSVVKVKVFFEPENFTKSNTGDQNDAKPV